MFDGCSTLEQLNSRRRELVTSGTPVAAVNAEYNKARRSLMEAKSSYRKVITYTSAPHQPKGFFAYPIREGGVEKKELVVGDGVIYI